MPINQGTGEAMPSAADRNSIVSHNALIYAIAHIQALPVEQQEYSDMCDMCALVRAQRSPFTIPLLARIEAETGRSVNLWPDTGEFSDCEIQEKRDIENRVSEWMKHYREKAA